MATQKSAAIEPNITECAVCHEMFTEPKLLPCSHILCHDCLVTCLQSQPQADCPICRCAIVDPARQGKQSVEEVADGFPTDLAMTAMVEAETLLSKQHVCCVCVNVAAVSLCLDCGDLFCQHCSNVHKRQTVTKHHEVEQLSSLTMEKLAAHHPATCPNHQDKVSEVYCLKHDTSLCVLCATTSHRNCPEVVSLNTKMGEWTAELFQLDDTLADAVAKADNDIILLEEHVQKLKKEFQDNLDTMKNICDRLKMAIDAHFLHFKTAALQLFTEDTKLANDLKKDVLQKRSRLVTHKNMTTLYTRFTEHKSFKEMIAMVKSRIAELEKADSQSDNLRLNNNLMMLIDPKLVSDTERLILRLGNVIPSPVVAQDQATAATTIIQTDGISDGQRPSGQTTRDEQLTSAPSVPVAKEIRNLGIGQTAIRFEPMTATPSRGRVIEVRSQEDSMSPVIKCITTNPSAGLVYLADSSNKSIKVLTLKTDKCASTFSLDVVPCRMSLTTDNLLAVTTEKNLIVVIDVTDTNKLFVQSKVATTRPYKGIHAVTTPNDGSVLLVGCGRGGTDPARVDMITLTGKWLRTVISSHSLPELRTPWYLHADMQQDELYITDGITHCVFRVQLSTGSVLSPLNHSLLSLPRQVCADSAGNLYVASTGCQCVLVRSVMYTWQELLEGPRHGEGGNVKPWGVGVVDSGLVVCWEGVIVKLYSL